MSIMRRRRRRRRNALLAGGSGNATAGGLETSTFWSMFHVVQNISHCLDQDEIHENSSLAVHHACVSLSIFVGCKPRERSTDDLVLVVRNESR